jgi:hypothetical protein
MSEPAAPVTTTALEAVQAGLRLKRAIANARHVLTPLGYCASQVVSFLEIDGKRELRENDDGDLMEAEKRWRDYEYRDKDKDEDEDEEDTVDEKEAETRAAALIEATNRRPPAL